MAETKTTTTKTTKGVRIISISDTNIAKIQGFDLKKFKKALEYNDAQSLAITNADGEVLFKVELTDKKSSLSHYGLLINKDTEDVITVSYDPTNMAVLVKAKSLLDEAIARIEATCALYDEAVKEIEIV